MRTSYSVSLPLQDGQADTVGLHMEAYSVNVKMLKPEFALEEIYLPSLVFYVFFVYVTVQQS